MTVWLAFYRVSSRHNKEQATERYAVFLRIDKLQIELPKPAQADPESAGVVQELLGGKFGEMSTLMNYTYQSFNMRGKSKVRPYYVSLPTSPPRSWAT